MVLKGANDMRITISAKNDLSISNYLRRLVDEKLSKLDRYLAADTEVKVTVSQEKTRFIVEVLIPTDRGLIRAEEVTGDMYASIDNVVDKLEKQITHHRTKLEKSLKADAFSGAFAEGDDTDEDEGPRIVRYKKVPVKPMDEEEALLQAELLGHSFYVFTNAGTGEVNVLYKRKDGNYGLIEPGE